MLAPLPRLRFDTRYCRAHSTNGLTPPAGLEVFLLRERSSLSSHVARRSPTSCPQAVETLPRARAIHRDGGAYDIRLRNLQSPIGSLGVAPERVVLGDPSEPCRHERAAYDIRICFWVLVAANIGNRSYSSYLSYLSDSSTRTLVDAEATPHRFVAVPCILPNRTRMELSPPIGASPCPSFQSYVAIRKHNVFFLVLHPLYPGFEASLRCRVSEVGVNPFESGQMKLAHEFAVGFFG